MTKEGAGEIRTLELRFHKENANHFGAFSRRQGVEIAWSIDGAWRKATMIFPKKTDRSRFLSAWAKESMT